MSAKVFRMGAKARLRFPLAHFSQELLSLLERGSAWWRASRRCRIKSRMPAYAKIIDGLLCAALRRGYFFAGIGVLSAGISATLHRDAQGQRAYRRSARSIDTFHQLSDADGSGSQETDRRFHLPGSFAVIGLLVAMFLLVFVVPKFSAIYEDFGSDLPWLSVLLIRWGHFVHEQGWLLAGIGTAVRYCHLRYKRGPCSKVRLARQLWRIPAIGERMRVYQLARFYRTLGMLLRGGIPVVKALEMVVACCSRIFGRVSARPPPVFVREKRSPAPWRRKD